MDKPGEKAAYQAVRDVAALLESASDSAAIDNWKETFDRLNLSTDALRKAQLLVLKFVPNGKLKYDWIGKEESPHQGKLWSCNVEDKPLVLRR